MTDTKRFAEALTGLAIALGSEMSGAKLDVYARALSSFPDEDIWRAIDKAACTMKWFPKPVELIELINGRGSQEERALVAWNSLLSTIKSVGRYQSIIFEDPKISYIVESMGGWMGLCDMRPGKETDIKRGQFMKAYAACPSNLERKQLAGLGELQQMQAGTKWIGRCPPIKPVCIGYSGATLPPGSEKQLLPEPEKQIGYERLKELTGINDDDLPFI